MINSLVEFIHPKTLEIITSSGKIFTAKDIFATSSPATNVGQYDFTEILEKLSSTKSLNLITTMKNQEGLVLKITQSILIEWQWLYQKYLR